MARLQIAGDTGFIAIHTCRAGGQEALGRASGLAAGATGRYVPMPASVRPSAEDLEAVLRQGALAGVIDLAGLEAMAAHGCNTLTVNSNITLNELKPCGYANAVLGWPLPLANPDAGGS